MMFFLRRHVHNDLATIYLILCMYGYPALLQAASSNAFQRGSRRKVGCLRKHESTGIICRRRLVIHPSINMEDLHLSLF